MKVRANKVSKKQEFIDFIKSQNLNMENASQGAQDYWTALTTAAAETEKPALTDKGAEVLKYIRTMDATMFKARDVAEGMGMAARSVSGTLTKLKNDSFLERLSESPAIYSLTEKGKTFEI